jgi:FdhD protein
MSDFAPSFNSSSSCRVCGKDTLEAVRTTARWSAAEYPVWVPATLLAGLPERLRPGRPSARRPAGCTLRILAEESEEPV